VEESPAIAAHLPISRQHEADLALHYRWIPYWESIAGGMGPAVAVPVRERQDGTQARPEPDDDAHLRSMAEVLGYRIIAEDDKVGHVEDFLVDTDGWAIRYMVVDTRNWLPGRKVIVAPDWVKDVDWPDSHVAVALSADSIRHSPVFDPYTPVNREYEMRLYDYYGRPAYFEQQREG
jgi:hypothetical protein